MAEEIFGHPQPRKHGPPAIGNPEITTWLGTHIAGDRLVNLKAFRRAFDLELAVAVEILNAYAERK